MLHEPPSPGEGTQPFDTGPVPPTHPSKVTSCRTPSAVRYPPDVSQPERFTGKSVSAPPTVVHLTARKNAETTPTHGSSVRCIGPLLPTVRWVTLVLWDGWNPWRFG